jgi:hypothetical protein
MIYKIEVKNIVCSYNKDFALSKPFIKNINKLNSIFENNNIIYFVKKKDYINDNLLNTVHKYFLKWNVKFSSIKIEINDYDMYISKDNINIEKLLS